MGSGRVKGRCRLEKGLEQWHMSPRSAQFHPTERATTPPVITRLRVPRLLALSRWDWPISPTPVIPCSFHPRPIVTATRRDARNRINRMLMGGEKRWSWPNEISWIYMAGYLDRVLRFFRGFPRSFKWLSSTIVIFLMKLIAKLVQVYSSTSDFMLAKALTLITWKHKIPRYY